MKKHTRQISFRADPELAGKVEAAAAFEELALADFVRKIFRFAFKEYETAGSLHALRAARSEEQSHARTGKKAG
jgi:hypothetical protein